MLKPQPVDSSDMVLRGVLSGGAYHQPKTYSGGPTNESGRSEMSKTRNKDPLVCNY